MSEWTICITPMPTEEALDIAARIADAEEPDCEDLLLTEGARVCDVLRCEVLHQAEVIERRTAELSTATGEVERLRAALAVTQRALEAAHTGERITVVDEIERLQRERDEARESALDRADDFDRLVIRVWRAATGDAHEGPASVEALVAAVVRLTNTIESVTGQICDMTTRHDSLRAIIEGRTVAPTDAEIDAHRGASGEWLVWAPGDGAWVTDSSTPEVVAIARECAERWWPLDRDGRPCARPVVEVSHG